MAIKHNSNNGLFALFVVKSSKIMAQLNESYKKENKFEFMTDFSSFAFGLGYSYTKIEGYRNLMHLTFMFWHLNFAWCWHKWGEPKNIVHKSADGSIVEVMPWRVRKCKTCGKKKGA